MNTEPLIDLTSILEDVIPLTQHLDDNFLRQLDNVELMMRGHERIIKTSVTQFIEILTPIHNYYAKWQRPCDNERVEKMRSSQEKEFAENGGYYSITTTMIILGYCPKMITDDNPYGIVVIDGQHRLATLREIHRFSPDNLSGSEILVKIFDAKEPSMLRNYFVTINTNWVPVPNYNLDDQVKKIVDMIMEWIQPNFDESFFKVHDGETRRPFLKIGTIRDKLSNCHQIRDLIDEYLGDEEKCAKIICDKFSAYNRHLGHKNPEDFALNQHDTAICRNAHLKCLKAQKQLFLGMERNCEWIVHAIEYKVEPIKLRFKKL